MVHTDTDPEFTKLISRIFRLDCLYLNLVIICLTSLMAIGGLGLSVCE